MANVPTPAELIEPKKIPPIPTASGDPKINVPAVPILAMITVQDAALLKEPALSAFRQPRTITPELVEFGFVQEAVPETPNPESMITPEVGLLNAPAPVEVSTRQTDSARSWTGECTSAGRSERT